MLLGQSPRGCLGLVLCCGCPSCLSPPPSHAQLPFNPLALVRPCLECQQWGPLSSTIFWFSCPQQKLTFFNSTLNTAGLVPEGEALPIPGAHQPGIVTKAGLILFGNDDRMVMVLLWVRCLYFRLQATHTCPGAQPWQLDPRLLWRNHGKVRL